MFAQITKAAKIRHEKSRTLGSQPGHSRITKNTKQGGLVISPGNKVLGAYDAWGNPLRVILRPPGKTVNIISYRGERVANAQSAVVISRAADGKWDTEDDLISGAENR